MKKKEMLIMINMVLNDLKSAPKAAEVEAKRYSDDPASQMPFQVGYLSSRIKNASLMLEEIIAKQNTK